MSAPTTRLPSLTANEIYSLCRQANEDATILVQASDQLGYAVTRFLNALKATNEHLARFESGLKDEKVQSAKAQASRRGQKSKRTQD
jgi:hypothetical protein